MSSDLVALVVAITLGIAVVVLGLRRNLSETTRDGLPRIADPERVTGTLGLYEGGNRRRHPPSPRQRRWLASFYLLIALMNAVFAVLSSHERPIHAATAASFALGAVVFLLRKSPHSSGDPVS